MRPETFEFDAEVVGAADDRQRAFLDALRDSIRRLAPDELDLSTTTAQIDDGVLFVTLPHRSEDDQLLAASVGSDEAVVYYGVEHEHFGPTIRRTGGCGRSTPPITPLLLARSSRPSWPAASNSRFVMAS